MCVCVCGGDWYGSGEKKERGYAALINESFLPWAEGGKKIRFFNCVFFMFLL